MRLITFIEERGAQSKIAKALEISPVLIHQWAHELRPVPVDRCPSIEFETVGSVTCEELCPDVNWVRIPDPDWPNPQGRPLVDHSQKKAA
jgi:DNA-binding transcriptional regulator YdaS (Cro superfamily)